MTLIKRHLITTADGSHSIFAPTLDEHYHSIHGAIQESLHVFIKAGLEALPKTLDNIHILEMGFGTGLNAFMTYLANQAFPNRTIHYTSLEAYPISEEMVLQLNYPITLQAVEQTAVFQQLHQAPWNVSTQITPKFTLTKLHTTLEEVNLPPKFHLIYYDAFAPSAQPELWTTAIFQKLYDALLPDGLLTTYCAKGVVKRGMKNVGFQVEGLPGPPRKREMTRAKKCQ